MAKIDWMPMGNLCRVQMSIENCYGRWYLTQEIWLVIWVNPKSTQYDRATPASRLAQFIETSGPRCCALMLISDWCSFSKSMWLEVSSYHVHRYGTGNKLWLISNPLAAVTYSTLISNLHPYRLPIRLVSALKVHAIRSTRTYADHARNDNLRHGEGSSFDCTPKNDCDVPE